MEGKPQTFITKEYQYFNINIEIYCWIIITSYGYDRTISIYIYIYILFYQFLSQNKAENICDPWPQKQS